MIQTNERAKIVEIRLVVVHNELIEQGERPIGFFLIRFAYNVSLQNSTNSPNQSIYDIRNE